MVKSIYIDVSEVWKSKPLVSTTFADESCLGQAQNTFRHLYYFIILLLMLSACNSGENYEFKLSDEEFRVALLDIEMAKEASRTASASIQDSLMNQYFGIISAQYNLTIDELKRETKERLERDDEFEAHYDSLKPVIDSLKAIRGKKK